MNPEALRLITEVCRRAAAGDLEARLPPLGDSAEEQAVRDAVNAVLDSSGRGRRAC